MKTCRVKGKNRGKFGSLAREGNNGLADRLDDFWAPFASPNGFPY